MAEQDKIQKRIKDSLDSLFGWEVKELVDLCDQLELENDLTKAMEEVEGLREQIGVLEARLEKLEHND